MKKKKGDFRAWVKAYGVTKLAAELKVVPRTIYWWFRERDGHQVRPRVEHAQKMVELSNGALTLEDILSPAPQEGARV